MVPFSPIKEDFIHFLWKTKKLPYVQYTSTDGREIEILEWGTHNLDSGPDFFNAKISIDGTIWAGNVEMHVFTTDWLKHRHQNDKAYDNVILHVVFEDDYVKTGDVLSSIPILELKGKIPKIYLDNYLNLIQSNDSIPCARLIHNVDKQKIQLWVYTLMIERLSMKAKSVTYLWDICLHDWEETLYILLARYFGSRVNTEPFERLARSLPLNIILKNKDKRNVLDALIFGQAGMLEANYTDPYFLELKAEYQFQRKKYQLTPIDGVSWKFSKLRPVNFPTLRLAQFSGLMYKVSFLFSQIKEAENPKEIRSILKATTHEYWKTHYTFDTQSAAKDKNMGNDFIDLLLINAIAPLLFYYGQVNENDHFRDMAISILEDIPPEKNSIINMWSELDIKAKSAFDSQALLQLKNNYCDQFKCLSCKIGSDIMNL